jgi:hypothetical protein
VFYPKVCVLRKLPKIQLSTISVDEPVENEFELIPMNNLSVGRINQQHKVQPLAAIQIPSSE